MFDTPRARGAVVVGLLLVLSGSFVYYGALGPAPKMGDYPTQYEFVEDAERYQGDRVVAFGVVTDADPVRVRVEYSPGEYATYRVRGVDHPVEPGDRLRVFGVLSAPSTIDAIDSFPVPPVGYAYTYTVSFLAGLWALSLIVRTWRFDRERLALVPRDRPLSLRALLGGGRDA